MSMLEMPQQSEIYDLMHKTSGQAKTFNQLLKEMKKAPQNLHKVLAHMSIKTDSGKTLFIDLTHLFLAAQNTATEDVVSYSDLELDEFDNETPLEVQRKLFILHTPHHDLSRG